MALFAAASTSDHKGLDVQRPSASVQLPYLEDADNLSASRRAAVGDLGVSGNSIAATRQLAVQTWRSWRATIGRGRHSGRGAAVARWRRRQA